MKKRALLVEDETFVRDLIKAALHGFEFTECESFGASLDALEHAREPFDLVILDLRLTDSEPPATIARLTGFMALAGDAPVLVMTGHRSQIEGRAVPADAILLKPFTISDLEAAVDAALSSHSPSSPRPVTSLLLAATRAALGPASLAFRHAAI